MPYPDLDFSVLFLRLEDFKRAYITVAVAIASNSCCTRSYVQSQVNFVFQPLERRLPPRLEREQQRN